MVVTLNCVAFPCNRQVLNPLPFSPPLVHLPSKLVQDPLSFITGRQVTIVGRHIHKGYDGYIKNTLQNGSVVVETEAGLRDIVVDLHNVYNRFFSFLPLSVSAPLPSGTSVSSSSAWHHPASNIRSVAGMTPMPTIASPGSLLHNSGTPAWDPSSRTPIYSSNTELLIADLTRVYYNHGGDAVARLATVQGLLESSSKNAPKIQKTVLTSKVSAPKRKSSDNDYITRDLKRSRLD
ncbi:hypothetical protein H0H93_007575 [Arthromyces matolae]|nr:hypothetical protein H0H93_007575 [Arthromyces matolae]